jgi:hypothetical protein
MGNLQKDFLPFELSLKMKQLGFDEPCLAKYITSDLVVKGCYKDSHIIHALFEENEICEAHILVPTFAQTFRWFREKRGLYGYPFSQSSQTNIWFKYFIQQEWKDQITSDSFNTHEEAELACLEKLIEIVENK